MKKTSVETAVGVFVLIGLISVAYLTIKLGKMEWFGDNYYTLDAQFDSVSGLKTGAQVDMAGVDIGRVADIRLDNDRQIAVVSLKIKKAVMLTDDVIASVKTSGLIGDKYIKLTPGGSDRLLKSGDMIIETESALDIEELVSKYVFGDANN
jgi:phospholipid/cholesterol/gamma-HCH transport system substrate-binding protein